MTEETVQNNPESQDSEARLQTLLVAFRQVGTPLLEALAETASQGGGAGEARPAFDAARFAELVDSTVALNSALAADLGGAGQGLDAATRWALVGSASQVVAASYRATGKAPAAEDAARIASIATTLQEKFKTQIPAGGESLPNTVATFRAMMMESMVPVIGAVAQYAFGRAEHALLMEVSERLVKTADQVTRALAQPGLTPEQWRLLCWNILRASGQIYTECHYAEADRLLYMNPDDRAAYFAQHGNVVPMTQVWQAFNQRMAMLATLATYLEVPSSAQLEKQGWP
jgi:hypothetical protein